MEDRKQVSPGDLLLRRRCAKILRDIPKSEGPLSIASLVTQVSAWRGRPIKLIPVEMPVEIPSGVWIDTGDQDCVYYEQRTSSLHRDHIIAHELGHMLFDHRSADEDKLNFATARILMPHLDPTLIRRVLGRTHFDEQEEREAETFATFATQFVNSSQKTPPRDAAAERLRATLEGDC